MFISLADVCSISIGKCGSRGIDSETSQAQGPAAVPHNPGNCE